MHADVAGLYDHKIPDHARGFFDPEKTRKWMYEDAVAGMTASLQKLETPLAKVRVKQLGVENPDKRFTLKQQKQAMLDRTDLTVPLKGVVELVSKADGSILDTKKVTLAHLPWLTDRNTVVYNGSEYSVTGQQRLKPGVYTRIKESGEAEAHVNVKAGTGAGGKVIFFPDKALFVYQMGTTKIKLYGLLKGLGISDAEMEQAWGTEIFAKNKSSYEGNEVEKLWTRIFDSY